MGWGQCFRFGPCVYYRRVSGKLVRLKTIKCITFGPYLGHSWPFSEHNTSQFWAMSADKLLELTTALMFTTFQNDELDTVSKRKVAPPHSWPLLKNMKQKYRCNGHSYKWINKLHRIITISYITYENKTYIKTSLLNEGAKNYDVMPSHLLARSDSRIIGVDY